MLRSGEILTVLTDTITLLVLAVCRRNISLSSFCMSRAMRDCRVVSIMLYIQIFSMHVAKLGIITPIPKFHCRMLFAPVLACFFGGFD